MTERDEDARIKQATVVAPYPRWPDESASIETPDPDATFVAGKKAIRSQPETGVILNERFRLGRELGHGGMATVYLAEEIETGRQVAVKMMQTRLEGTARQRFTREFSTIASIKHPSCLEVFEYGESDTGPFFVMELFAGEPATALIGQPLPIALKALYQIAEAVDYVHSRRIIHRDIKPGNILVRSKPDGSGFDVRLADFGLAKFANTSSSLSGEDTFLGTIAYCAPEQIMRDELDHRCDIYSFGLVCYEVLAGRHPYSEVRRNVQALVAKHLRDVPPTVRSCNPEVVPDIDSAVMQMLAKDAGRRPQSTVLFRKAIATFLNWTTGQERPEPESEGRQLVGTFVSRDHEKRLLESLMAENLLLDDNSAEDWLDEQPVFLAVLTGPAGLGKSTLLRQVARSAMANGARVYEGRCLEGNLAPFQPFVEIVRQLLMEQAQLRSRSSGQQVDRLAQTTVMQAADPTVRVDLIFQEYAPELLRIAPELRDLLPGEAFSSDAGNLQQTDHILRAIAKFFVELGKVQRICLLLEDLHWADNSSLSLLVYLGAALRTERREAAAQREPAPRVFVCATTRPEADYPSVAAPLGQLRQQDNQRTIELTPFDEQGVRSLAAALLGAVPEQIDGQLIEHITSQCFGNPFFIAQSIREFRKLGQIAFHSGRWRLTAEASQSSGSMTESVRAALRERVLGLDPLPARMLAVAAVIGNVIDIELLRDVVGHQDQFEFLDALDLLLARHILNETGQARRVTFTHDLIREAVLERQASSQQTKRLHEAVALRLEGLAREGKPVSSAKLAEHFLSADIRDKAFHYLLQAGTDAVAAFAYRDAILLLEKAREIMLAGTAAKLEFQLCSQLARAYAAVDTLVSAEAMYREAIRTAEQPLDRAEALQGLGDVFNRRRQSQESLKTFQEALREVRHPLRTNPVNTVIDIIAGSMFMFLLPESLRRKMKIRRRTEQERSRAFQITHAATHCQMDVSLLGYLQLCNLLVIRAHQTGMPDDMACGYAKYATNLSLYGIPFYPLRFAKRAGSLATEARRPYAVAYTETLTAAVTGFSDNLSEALDDAETALKGFGRLGESFSRLLVTHCVRHLCEYYGDAKRELMYADEELRMAVLSDDWEKTTWGLYGRADALARGGEFSEAQLEMKKAFELLGDKRSIVTRPVAVCTEAYVLLQASKYDQAFASALLAQRLTERGVGVFIVSAKAYPLAIEAGLGPNWHDPNAHAAIRADKGRMRTMTWVLWKCLGIGALFMVARAHSLRVRGRHAFVTGHRRKAVRLIHRAIAIAEKQGSPYELARALLDRSLINPDTAVADREKGQSLLRELSSVLPVAEQTAFR